MAGGNAFAAPVTQGFGRGVAADGPADYNGEHFDHFNRGYDFGAGYGDDVPAMTSGTVVWAGDAKDGWGTSVKVRDPNGFVHSYGHLSAANVRPGDSIQRGQNLGQVGYTGNVYPAGPQGTHLSYDVWREDDPSTPVDPAPWLGGDAMTNDNSFYRDYPSSPNTPGSVPMPQYGSGANTDPGFSRGGSTLGSAAQAILASEIARVQAIDLQLSKLDPRNKANASAIGMLTDQKQTAIQNINQLWTTAKTESPYDIAVKQAELDRQFGTDWNKYVGDQYTNQQSQWSAGNQLSQQDFENRGQKWTRDRNNQVDIGTLQRQGMLDDKNIADSKFANSMAYRDRQIAEGKLTQDQAVNDVNRSLGGLAESRDRSAQIIKQTMDTAARMRPYGADYMPFMEPGGPVAGLMSQLGMNYNPNAGFKYAPGTENPGYVTVDPRGELASQDSALGVSGPIPTMPQFSLPPMAPPPDYNGMRYDPTQLIAGLQSGDSPAPPTFDMSGYPSMPAYRPPSPPQNLSGLSALTAGQFAPVPIPGLNLGSGVSVVPPQRDTPATDRLGMEGYMPPPPVPSAGLAAPSNFAGGGGGSWTGGNSGGGGIDWSAILNTIKQGAAAPPMIPGLGVPNPLHLLGW